MLNRKYESIAFTATRESVLCALEWLLFFYLCVCVSVRMECAVSVWSECVGGVCVERTREQTAKIFYRPFCLHFSFSCNF